MQLLVFETNLYRNLEYDIDRQAKFVETITP
jgi:hypothetical protein